MKRIYLASASPRRKALLEQIGINPEIIVSQYEESQPAWMSPAQVVVTHATGKVKSSNAKLEQKDALLIGADTVVAIAGNILGKPHNRDQAFAMLKQLSGNTHEVYTGVAVLDQVTGNIENAWDCTQVTLRQMRDAEIQSYLNTNEPYDKAGAYAIQGLAALFIEHIQGSYSNVVGLPLCLLSQLLQKCGYLVASQW